MPDGGEIELAREGGPHGGERRGAMQDAVVPEAGRYGAQPSRARRGPQRASIFGPGDIVGELAFFDAEPREADVRAREPSEVMALTPDGFDRLRIAYPRLALLFTLDLGRVLSLRFRQHNRRLAALGEL